MKIEDLDRPAELGEWFSVPCIVTHNTTYSSEFTPYIFPLIDNLHDDKKSGQLKKHYHIDSRFILYNIGMPNDFSIVRTIIEDYDGCEYIAHNSIRFFPDKDTKIVYKKLQVLNLQEEYATPTRLIADKKYKCIKNDKCPHKGYDLRNVLPVNGVVRCPLHGLKFDKQTGMRTDEEYKILPRSGASLNYHGIKADVFKHLQQREYMINHDSHRYTDDYLHRVMTEVREYKERYGLDPNLKLQQYILHDNEFLKIKHQ